MMREQISVLWLLHKNGKYWRPSMYMYNDQMSCQQGMESECKF